MSEAPLIINLLIQSIYEARVQASTLFLYNPEHPLLPLWQDERGKKSEDDWDHLLKKVRDRFHKDPNLPNLNLAKLNDQIILWSEIAFLLAEASAKEVKNGRRSPAPKATNSPIATTTDILFNRIEEARLYVRDLYKLKPNHPLISLWNDTDKLKSETDWDNLLQEACKQSKRQLDLTRLDNHVVLWEQIIVLLMKAILKEGGFSQEKEAPNSTSTV